MSEILVSNIGKIKLFWQKNLILSVILLSFFACSDIKQSQNEVFGKPYETSISAQQKEIIEAQANKVRRKQVTVSAHVFRLLPDDLQGIPHQKFLIRLTNNTTVLIAHDTKLAPRVPLQEGDFVTIHGEYIYNEKGGVLHFTHRSFNGRHEGGWIDLNGMRYQ
jgi:hypothetical protein